VIRALYSYTIVSTIVNFSLLATVYKSDSVCLSNDGTRCYRI